jgi:hypothetical protein
MATQIIEQKGQYRSLFRVNVYSNDTGSLIDIQIAYILIIIIGERQRKRKENAAVSSPST